MIRPEPFGKYTLVKRIAYGGMAEIFKAKLFGAKGFAKDLVIKRILPQYSQEEEFVQMFIDEATLAAKLAHANIVQIFDFGHYKNSYYLAMEYVEGQNLKQVLERAQEVGKPITFTQAVRICIDICKGLNYAHKKKVRDEPLLIIHQDISPENILISYNGEVKIADFGIARAASRVTSSHKDQLKGKIQYMSPEQARGEAFDQRIDIFATGILLWEMLTGRKLFDAANEVKTLQLVVSCKVPPVAKFNPTLPPEIQKILDRALTSSPRDRYPVISDMESDLQRFLHAADLEESTGLDQLMHELFSSEIAVEARESGELAKLQETDSEALLPDDDELSEKPTATMVEAPTPHFATYTRERSRHNKLIFALVAGLFVVAGLVIYRFAGRMAEWPSTSPGGQTTVATGSADVRERGEPTRDRAGASMPTITYQKVRFESSPTGAKLVVDGSREYMTPVTLEDLELGSRHLFQMTAVGYSGRKQWLDVTAKLKLVRWVLQKEPANATVESTPAGATIRLDRPKAPATPKQSGFVQVGSQPQANVFFDGRKVGTTPCRIELPVGRQVLVLENSQLGMRKRISVIVFAGRTVVRNVRLEYGSRRLLR